MCKTEVNKTIMHAKHFQMICKKVNMIQPSQKFLCMLVDFKTPSFKHLLNLNIRVLKIQLNRMWLFVSAVASGGKEPLKFLIFFKQDAS